MNKARGLVTFFSPSIRFVGQKVLAAAIHQTVIAAKELPFDDILVTKNIYPEVAKTCGTTLLATERAVCRATDACWMNGNNKQLNRVIGTKLPERPAPSELILYCAYFLIHNAPYHSIKTSDPAKLPF